MKKSKFISAAAVILQFPANKELDVIIDQETGTMYFPAAECSALVSSKTTTEETPTAPKAATKKVVDEEEETPAPKTKAASKPASTSTGKVYTEKEMMEMEPKELEKILVKMDVDFASLPGRNTNKKLRDLILENQEGAPASSKKEVEEEEEEGEKTIDAKKVEKVLADLDSGNLEEDKAITKLINLGVSEKVAQKQIARFMAEPDTEIDDLVEAIVSGEVPAAKKEVAKKAGPKGKAKNNIVEDWDDLEKGDKVSVYWESEKDYFDGKVKRIDDDGILIRYNDGTEAILDEDNTEIKRLEEDED